MIANKRLKWLITEMISGLFIIYAAAFVPVDIPTDTMEVSESPVILEASEIECETVHFEVVRGAKPQPATIVEEPETEESLTEAETEPETIEEELIFPTYTVNGAELDPALYEYIRVTLSSMNMSDYMPYVLCQIYQESRFNPYAENPNGQDKGLLQFRLKYWNWSNGDIFDPYAQLRVYLNRVKAESDAGHDIYTIISNHYSGGAWYDAQYVSDVLQWINTVGVKE